MTTPVPARNPALRILDIVVGILAGIVGMLAGLALISLLSGIQLQSGVCDAGCDSTPLTVWRVVGIVIIGLSWTLTAILFLARAIRRRVAFFFPLIGIVLMIAGFYLAAAGIGAWTGSLGVTG